MENILFATETNQPWVLTLNRPITQMKIPEGILLLELDAASMADLDGMYREFSKIFKFPDYFGNNMDALDECLTDLEWLPADGYLLVIKNSDLLLNKEPQDVLDSLLSILESAGEEWATPVNQGEEWDREGKPFHTVLESNKE